MTIHDQIKRGRELCEGATQGPWSHTHIFAGEEIISAGFDGQTHVGTIFEQFDGEFIEHHNPQHLKQLYDLLDTAIKTIKTMGCVYGSDQPCAHCEFLAGMDRTNE